MKNQFIQRSLRMIKVTLFAAAFAALGLGLNTASAQTTSLSKADVKFLKEASQGGLFEVETGNYAAANGNADSVKKFGQHMATDHAALNQKLMDFAQKNGITLDPTPSVMTSAKIKASTMQTGAAFDKSYMEMMVKNHREDLRAFENEAASTSNSDLKSLVTDAISTIRSHLKIAHHICKTVCNS